ncbi:MAG: hypothetical protein QM800_12805 [Paludibacter sp.]
MSKLAEQQDKPERNPFGEWVQTIPVGEYDNIRERIIEDCKISKQVFRHWKNGNSKVPALAKPIINRIAGKNIFED